MNQHTSRFIVLVVAQAACLALGLWLEQRFTLLANQPEWKGAATANDAPAGPGSSSAPQDAEKEIVVKQETPIAAIRAMAFIWIVALQAVVAYLVLSRVSEETSRWQSRAEKIAVQRDRELLSTRDAVIFGLAKLAESRDADTGNHLERIALYSTRLATALRRKPQYRREITPHFVKLIGISASLHDIGKVGIADSILLKPGGYDDLERREMQIHAMIGGKCIRDIESRLGKSDFLQMAREIAFAHHERWDGAGYPRGLAGEEIPLAARIVALADVYDALAMKRVYKHAIPHAQCVAMIKEGRGTHFDPAIVAAFLEIEADFQDIAQRYSDAAERNADDAANADVASSPSSDGEQSTGNEQCYGGEPCSSNEQAIDDDLETAVKLLAHCLDDPFGSDNFAAGDTERLASAGIPLHESKRK